MPIPRQVLKLLLNGKNKIVLCRFCVVSASIINYWNYLLLCARIYNEHRLWIYSTISRINLKLIRLIFLIIWILASQFQLNNSSNSNSGTFLNRLIFYIIYISECVSFFLLTIKLEIAACFS